MTPTMETEAIETKALTTADQAKLMVVTSVISRVRAAELGKVIAGLEKEAVDFFKPMKQAAAQTHKEICNRENSVVEPLKEAKQHLSRIIGTWDQEQERLRVEEERRLQAEADAQAAEEARIQAEEQAIADAIVLEAEGDKQGAEAVLANPMPVPAVHTPVVLQRQAVKTAGVSTQTRWNYRIDNVDAIPRQYMIPDAVQIGQIVRASKDKTNIPGITVYPEGGARFSSR